MLFKLEDEKDFFDLNPEAKLFEPFKRRSSQQMVFVALVADKESPLRTLPEDKRREKAAIAAGYTGMDEGRPDKNFRDLVGGKVETVEAAIAHYKELQYDEDQAMLDSINQQIQDAIRMGAMNKEEACTVVKTKRYKDGTREEERFLDTKRLTAMAIDIAKYIERLPALRRKKKELLGQVKADRPDMPLNVTTHTAADIPEDIEELKMSTLDKLVQAGKIGRTDDTI